VFGLQRHTTRAVMRAFLAVHTLAMLALMAANSAMSMLCLCRVLPMVGAGAGARSWGRACACGNGG
jgi:hypothetical protein